MLALLPAAAAGAASAMVLFSLAGQNPKSESDERVLRSPAADETDISLKLSLRLLQISLAFLACKAKHERAVNSYLSAAILPSK